MRKLTMFFGIVAMTLFITACGDNNDNASDSVTDNENEVGDSDSNNNTNSPNNENENNDNASNDPDSDTDDDMQAKMDELPFTEIEIEVDYGKDNEYEVEIEQDESGTIEAEIEDEINDVYMQGEEAFNELYPKVKKLSIDKETDKETAIKDVLDTFDLDDDYDEFELEITFNDGTELEHEDK